MTVTFPSTATASATPAQKRYVTTLGIRWGKVPTKTQLELLDPAKARTLISWYNARLAKANREVPAAPHQREAIATITEIIDPLVSDAGAADRFLADWAKKASSQEVWEVAQVLHGIAKAEATPGHGTPDMSKVKRRDDDHFNYDGTLANCLPVTTPGLARRVLNGPSASRTASEEQVSSIRYAAKVAKVEMVAPETLSYTEAAKILRRLQNKIQSVEGRTPVQYRHFLSIPTKAQATNAKTRFGAKWCDVKKSYYVDRRTANWSGMPHQWLGIAVGDIFEDAILGN